MRKPASANGSGGKREEKSAIFKESSSGDWTVYMMFSDSRQLGKGRVSPHGSTPQHWLHNGVMVQGETGHTGPRAQTEAKPLPPDRRSEAGLMVPEEKGNSCGKESTETNFHGLNHRRGLLLPEQEQSARSDSVSQRGPREPGAARWNPVLEQRQRRGPSGREPLGECICSGHGYQTEPHPSGRKYVSPPPTGFKGQGSYRAPGYTAERQFRDYAREDYQRGPHECGRARVATRGFNRQHGSDSTFLGAQEYASLNNGCRDLIRAETLEDQGWHGPGPAQGVIFSTEVPQRELDYSRQKSLCWSSSNVTDVQNKRSSTERGQKREPATGRPKMSQASVRDQIRRVVVDLEGVLGGLKQVHLEMKEVVQQIELLTSNIDLGEEDPSNSFPGDTLCSSSSSGVTVSSHRGVGSHASLKNAPTPSSPLVLDPSAAAEGQGVAPSPRGAPRALGPASPTRGPDREPRSGRAGPRSALPKLAFQSQNRPLLHEPERGACRSKKPPPYPHNGQVPKTGKGREWQRAPPYPAKRRALSTMV